VISWHQGYKGAFDRPIPYSHPPYLQSGKLALGVGDLGIDGFGGRGGILHWWL
jgi:hypothetical protein